MPGLSTDWNALSTSAPTPLPSDVSRHLSRNCLITTPPKTLTSKTHETKVPAPPNTNANSTHAPLKRLDRQTRTTNALPWTPTIFPKGLKRPDLTASVDGHAIASKFQQKLYDDIVAGHCVHCHARDHSRSTCKEQAGRWETKFDNEKEKYWTGKHTITITLDRL